MGRRRLPQEEVAAYESLKGNEALKGRLLIHYKVGDKYSLTIQDVLTLYCAVQDSGGRGKSVDLYVGLLDSKIHDQRIINKVIRLLGEKRVRTLQKKLTKEIYAKSVCKLQRKDP